MTRLTKSEISYFCYQLAVVFRSGLPVAEGIDLLATDFEDKKFTELAARIAHSIDAGSTVTDSIRAAEVFPLYVTEMVSVGEETGRLAGVFAELADYYESRTRFAKKLRSALAYPIALTVLMFAVLVLLVFNVLPALHDLLATFGGTAPAATQWIFGLSEHIKYWVIGILCALAVFGILLAVILRTNHLPKMRNAVLLRSPVIGRIYRKSLLVRFSRAMHMLISSGYSFDTAVVKTLPILEDSVIRKQLEQAAREIGEGRDPGGALEQTEIFPSVFFRMIKLGSKTGMLEEMLEKFTSVYERELESEMTRATDVIEPTLVAVLSVVIGMILMMIMLPLINIIGAIG